LKKRKTSKKENAPDVANIAGKNAFGKIPEREIWAVDSETDPFKAGRIPQPFIWGCYNGSEYYEFDTVGELLTFLSQRDCIAYAHNGGRFDWHYLLPAIEPFTSVMVIAGRLAKFKIGKCEFRDSYNIMPMPLRAGGHKYEIEDFGIFEREVRDLPGNRAVIRERLRTDCLYLYRMLETFFVEFGLHLTISSASMSCWAKIADVKKPETSPEFYARFAPYYFGGRVESFAKGEIHRPFKIIDINSAYPDAMMYLHPYGEIPHESLSLPNSRGAIQRSFITIECDSVGAFPFRADNGGLEFPSDGQRRLFHVTGWEFLAALETGCFDNRTYDIAAVLQLPEQIEFRSYMNHFYQMKTDAKANKDDARYEFSKRFLCSLYGKFGSNPEKYSEYQLVPPRFIEAACESDGYSFCAELGPHALLSRPLSEHKQRFYNVAVSASVCGFVRAKDWRAMCDVRRAGHDVHYIDTDCLHATDTGNLDLDDTKLGAWKVEAECTYGAYAGKKTYACLTNKLDKKGNSIWKKASKGVKLTVEQICEVARGNDIEFVPEVPQYSMKRGIHFVPRKIRKTA